MCFHLCLCVNLCILSFAERSVVIESRVKSTHQQSYLLGAA